MKKCTICNRRIEELTEREKRSVIHGLQDPESYVKVTEKTFGDSMTVASVLRWMRDQSWDLWAACDFLRARLRFLEKSDKSFPDMGAIKHGSCQNTYMRTTAQLVYYYNVPVDCFYEWDT